MVLAEGIRGRADRSSHVFSGRGTSFPANDYCPDARISGKDSPGTSTSERRGIPSHGRRKSQRHGYEPGATMSREEMLKHTTGRTRVFLDTLTNQAGLDAWELALEQFPRMRELPPQEQAWTVESVMQIMEENKLPTTIDDALHA